MIRIPLLNNRILLLSVFFIFSLKIFAQADAEQIFKTNCVSCHTIGGGRLIGPDLEGVTKKRKADWLKKWINSSSELIASGDPDAIAIFEEYNKVAMQSFYFSDEDMDALLAYLENPPVEEVSTTTTTQIIEQEKGMSNSSIFLLIAILLLILIYILISIKNKLKTKLDQPTETPSETVVNFMKVFLSETRNVLILGFFVFILVMKFTFDALMGIGVTTNYMPEQPIAFSLKIHAGDNEIDCNYCHTSARTSKTSGIPSANVCMNCHENITSGTNTGTAEIQKIYDAIGYDPEKRQYIDGYEQKPIQWVRIHNLPDLAYFNHAQHVSVAGLECQECHGPVEEMEVLYQHADLTMGWCVECHRETEVKMEENDYYTRMHEKMKEKYAGQKITVDKMGGLECGKCHY